MTYRVPLPVGGRVATLDLVEPNSTAVQRFIRRRGLAEYEPATAAAILAVCEQQPAGFTMFDIGANMGLYGAMAAAMFDVGRVHLFEPAPISAAAARRIIAANGLSGEVFEVAVSDQNGQAELQLSSVSDASNSLVVGFKESMGSVTVATTRLDDHVLRTGVGPDVLKIDVETHEAAVLAGARETLIRHRPVIVIEVLRRRGVDHGVVIAEMMAEFGYHYYELSANPTWEARPTIRGSGRSDRDWLLTPAPLDASMPASWQRWADALAECTVDRNPRPPLIGAARAAFRRGGVREIVAAARRYRESLSS